MPDLQKKLSLFGLFFQHDKELITITFFYISIIFCVVLIVIYELFNSAENNTTSLAVKLLICISLISTTCGAVQLGSWSGYAWIIIIGQLLFSLFSILLSLRNMYPEHNWFYTKTSYSLFLLYSVSLVAAILALFPADTVSLTISVVASLLLLAVVVLCVGFFKIDLGKTKPYTFMATAICGFALALSCRFAFGDSNIGSAPILFIGIIVLISAEIAYLYSQYGKYKNSFPFFVFSSAAFFASQLITSISVIFTKAVVS